MNERLDELNKEQWTRSLEQLFVANNRARRGIIEALNSTESIDGQLKSSAEDNKKSALEIYKLSKDNPVEYEKALQDMKKVFAQCF